MRDFTPEEKELIINTPITKDCFEYYDISVSSLNYLSLLETKRQDLQRDWYHPEGINTCFEHYVDMLPNSYKVVKL